jgi:AAA+ superfamily predicted ATPase
LLCTGPIELHEIEYDWFSENREYLIASIQYAKSLLASLASGKDDNGQPKYAEDFGKIPTWPHGDPVPALETLSQTFHLSKFEKNILVLCAGAEIDGEVSGLCSKLYNNSNSKFPTFDIALRTFPGADWEAILPDSNLRRFQLVTMHNYDDVPLITTPVRIQERILHYLLGFKSVMDNNLDYLVRPVQMTAPVADSAKSRISDIVELYTNSQNKTNLPIFHLWGPDADSNLLVAQRVCEELGLGLWNIPGELLPSKSSDEQLLSGLLSRECFLAGNALYIDAYDADDSLRRAITRFAGRCLVPLLFLGTRQPWSSFTSDKSLLAIELKRPTKEDQREMWRQCFERTMRDEAIRSHYLGEIYKIVDRVNLDAISIEMISKKISSMQSKENDYDPLRLYTLLQSSTYRLTKTRLGDLAEEIIPIARIDDIILPVSRKSMIQAIALHFKHRRKVYDEWGFAKKSSRGLGITALFSGESGTGKTMAAEAIANELGADLYRIDLSMVASKYIGETEKNLRQIFDAAETKECILFFDEADSLFGKRSEVKDSHDRYANLQVGYLLQRIESYDGVVILATNFKKSLDPAFMRRLRFIIDFPFPDEKSREEIWRKIFPENVPLAPLDFKFLSRLSITGGSIRNIALNAAFLAAEEGGAVSMNHIRRAAEEEYNKLGRGMSTAEVGNWP